ncbi:hypothetical protein [Photobacterium kishitanii]|uniref:hypothetical protein n=1 Tax=Photobacterium kishitanii TaxID=318456 RepID=UPI0007F86E71|nr:hypothetical protein [Photobacterium kishitanii]OBU33861.1 hypothetical protein AYY23_13585 [Photobacterium kishitanii]PSW47124.1 hypothetical protein C0W66_19720 [Photobacterium kishitanii]
MLKAILHGKAGRIEHQNDESVSWSSLFKTREDLLTSTVFERFGYLSESLQDYLLIQFFNNYHGVTPDSFGEFEGITYWPRFNHEHEAGSNQVEPDLIIHFDQCNIIVEVKPPAGSDQYFGQWKKEVESLLQSDNDHEKPLYFLAIGRIGQADAKCWARKLLQEFDELKGLAALEWKDVSTYIMELTHIVNPTLDPFITKKDKRILLDILEGLSLYGLQVSPFKWAQFNDYLLPKLTLDHRLLQSNVINSANIVTASKSMSELLVNTFQPLDLQLIQPYLKNNVKDSE